MAMFFLSGGSNNGKKPFKCSLHSSALILFSRSYLWITTLKKAPDEPGLLNYKK
jgi:hypothetical protein